MGYVAVVPTIYNAALNGALEGMLTPGGFLGTTQSSYTTIANVAAAFAQEVDATLGADATLAGGGATVVPATAANQNAALSKPSLMQGLSRAFWTNRGSADVTPADWLTAANTVIAAYKQAFATQSLL